MVFFLLNHCFVMRLSQHNTSHVWACQTKKKCDQYNKRDILFTPEKVVIFAMSNKLYNNTQFMKMEVMLLEMQLLQVCIFIVFSLYFTHYFVHYPWWHFPLFSSLFSSFPLPLRLCPLYSVTHATPHPVYITLYCSLLCSTLLFPSII